jgi:hypothetical protein
MLASLAWFRGTPYVYIDHPGTPVEILGTGLLLLSHPFVQHASDLIAFHLDNPQLFLSIAQTVLVLASLLVCVWLARASVPPLHWSFALLAVAVSGLFLASDARGFLSLAEWSHESFNFPAGTAFSFAVLALLRRPKRLSWRWLIACGVGAGVLISIQLYFTAWCVGTVTAFVIADQLHGASWRSTIARALTVLAMTCAGFVLATLPIHDRYGDLADWVLRLVSHQETYGYGAEGFSTPQLMTSNTFANFSQAPVLMAAALVVVAVIVWRLIEDLRGPQRDVALWSVGIGLSCQALVVVALAAKHPGAKYLLPLAATLPILVAAAFGSARVTRQTVGVATVLGAVGIAALGASFWFQVSAHLALRDNLVRGDQATMTVLDRVAAEHTVRQSSLQVLWTYGTTSPCYALWFGDETTGQAFSRDLARLCPHDLNLSVFSARVIREQGSTPVADLFADRADPSSALDWDVALIPSELVATRPAAVPPGVPDSTSIPSLRYGSVMVFHNTAQIRGSE